MKLLDGITVQYSMAKSAKKHAYFRKSNGELTENPKSTFEKAPSRPDMRAYDCPI